jgi:hypothetical protein
LCLDQTTLYCVKNRLKPVMRAEFLVDGMEMISQSRQSNIQFLCNLRRILRSGKQFQDACRSSKVHRVCCRAFG